MKRSHQFTFLMGLREWRAKILIKFVFFHHSLVYVSERKIERGQHNVYFNCELFTGRFIEYCFVYVTEAKTGAVADIRMDCVPTSPIYGNLLCRRCERRKNAI